MNLTPTSPGRTIRHADFSTLTEALDFAAAGETGVNFHDLRGRLLLAMPYATLRDEARAMARRLLAAGLRPGDRAGLIADSTPEFVRAFMACQYAAVAPVPLPLPAPLGGRDAYVAQVGRMLASAQAGAVVVAAPAFEDWLADAARIAETPLTIRPDEAPDGASQALPPILPDQTSYLQFSSGSTRFPTGVVVTHRALMANAVAIARHGLKVTAADRAVSWLPLYHDMGLIGFLLTPLATQMSLDLLPTAAFVRRPRLWLDLMARNGGTVSYSPTFGYDLCARRGEGATDLDLSGWRVAGVGGDMIRPAPLEAFAAQFAGAGFRASAFVASYGMAEATLALTMAPLGQGLRTERVDVDRMEQHGLAEAGAAQRQRSFVRCGPILPGHELQVRDEGGRALPERRIGRIFARGPSLMREYFAQPEATAAALSPEGWLDTGDLGFLVDDEVTPTGRAKDLILFNGRNIWPQDLEWAAEEAVDGLRSGDVAAFSIDDEAGERVVLLVQCRSSDPQVRQAIVDGVTAVLRAQHGVDSEVQLVGAHALPRTSSGKLSRSKTRTLYETGAFDLVRT